MIRQYLLLHPRQSGSRSEASTAPFHSCCNESPPIEHTNFPCRPVVSASRPFLVVTNRAERTTVPEYQDQNTLCMVDISIHPPAMEKVRKRSAKCLVAPGASTSVPTQWFAPAARSFCQLQRYGSPPNGCIPVLHKRQNWGGIAE